MQHTYALVVIQQVHLLLLLHGGCNCLTMELRMSHEEEFTPKSLLLTGGAGFIGSAVLLHLVERFPDCHFVCIDKLSYCSSTEHFSSIKDNSNFKFVKGSVASLDLVTYVLDSEKIDTVMHFAAQSHVDNSFGNSIAFTMDNVLGTHVLLEACRLFKHQIKRIIHVSTDEVYGEAPLGKVPYNFEHSLQLRII